MYVVVLRLYLLLLMKDLLTLLVILYYFQENLICFTREGTEDILGCSGQGETGDDHYTGCPSDSYLVYKENGQINMGLCEGYCGTDTDCATSFY